MVLDENTYEWWEIGPVSFWASERDGRIKVTGTIGQRPSPDYNDSFPLGLTTLAEVKKASADWLSGELAKWTKETEDVFYGH